MSKILIKKARTIDPSQNLDDTLDILISDGKIEKIGKSIQKSEAKVIEATGLVLCPSFVDIHVHLRDPGQTYKEDIESGSKCAVAGGYTTLVCMPNTIPPIDDPAIAQYIINKSEKVGLCKVFPAGAITKGRKGKELTDFYALKKAGCVALTDDGAPLMDSLLMQRALELAADLGLLIMNHCEDDRIAHGHINEGSVSSLLGIPSRPASAEDILVARDCILSYHIGSPIHMQHISSSLSLDIIRSFKEKGAKVSCEVNPYHLFFTEEEILRSYANAKVNPPLRKETSYLISGLVDGTIDCIATDHAPHAPWEKSSIEKAMPGMIGLQTALPLMLKLVEEGIITLKRMVELMSYNPLKILNLPYHPIKEGETANLVIFDPKQEWILNEATNMSKSKNTPLWNKKLKGKVKFTFFEGRIVYED